MPVALGEVVSAARTPSMLLSFGSPYLISQVPGVAGYLLAWSATPQSEEVVAEALGGAAITGRLPVALPPFWKIGDGKTEGRKDGK